MMLIKKIFEAKQGRRLIKKIVKQENNKEILIVVEMSDDFELLSYAVKYYDELLIENPSKKTVLLYKNDKSPLARLQFNEKFKITLRNMNKILSFYCLYQFSQNIIFLSLHQPDSCKLCKLVENGLITKEEAVAIGMYKLKGEKVCQRFSQEKLSV